MSPLPAPRKPTLAQRALELHALAWPGASIALLSGRELQYRFTISPSAFGRQYECLLAMKPDSRMPLLLVLKPDLIALGSAGVSTRHLDAAARLALAGSRPSR